MKIRLTIAGILAAVAVHIITLAGSANAALPPVLEGGDIFWSRNITKGSGFVDPNTADACDELQYRVRIHIPSGDTPAQNVTVQAAIPSGATTKHVSTIVIKASNTVPSSVSDTATVNLSSSQTIKYEAGSAQLLDAQGNVISSLSDAIVGPGVSIGNVGVSINEKRFVQYKAKVSCPPPPEQPAYACTNLSVAADENRGVKITAFTTSQSGGATFKNGVVDWGDNSANTTAVNLVGQTHTYDKVGTYTIAATAHFMVGDKEVTASGPACTKTVTFSSKPETPPTVTPTPPSSTTTPTTTSAAPTVQQQPTTLVNTGPGSVAGAFAAATLLGAYGYRRYLMRKLDHLAE